MKKYNLPRLQQSPKFTSPTHFNHKMLSPFKNILKKYKLSEINLKNQDLYNKLSSKFLITAQSPKKALFDIEEDDEEKLKEENKLLIEGQKYLIKLYENKHSSVIDKLRTEMQEYEKMNNRNTRNKKNLPYLNISDNNKVRDSHNLYEKDYTTEDSDTTGKSKLLQFTGLKRTNYIDKAGMKEFYGKYANYNQISRKYYVKKDTPSLAFIKASTDEKIIPNPLGLIRRSGDSDKLNYNFQKIGDKYMVALSSSLKYSNNITSMDFGYNRLSKEGVDSLFKIITENKILARQLKEINLSENNIGNKNLESLILFLQEPNNILESLNLYGTILGNENVINICDNLGKYVEQKLINLNLGKNEIHDETTNAICSMLKYCTGLRTLNLSHNWLHNKSAAKIITALSSNIELKILDLSYNCIGDDLVAIPSYEELVNSEIKHPDKNFDNFALNEALGSLQLKLRRNPLLPPIDDKKQKEKNDKKNQVKEEAKEPSKVQVKPKTPSDFAIALGDYFADGSLSLIHLDISHNNINDIDSKLLSEKVKLNHTILGLHVDGNEMAINELGFIIPIAKNKKDEKYFSGSQITYNIDKKYSLRKSTIDNVSKIRRKNNCWICDGFREYEFEYFPEEPIADPNNHIVKIHLNFDDYKPFDMIYADGRYHMARMCPPGEIRYFLTFDTEVIKSHETKGKNELIKVDTHFKNIEFTFDNEYMEELKNLKEKLSYELKQSQKESLSRSASKEVEASKMNKIPFLQTDKNISVSVDTIFKIHIKYNNKVIDENFRKLFKFAVPRPEKIINRFIKPRTPWSFPISIWASYGYKYDDVSDAYLKQCFASILISIDASLIRISRRKKTWII